MMMVTYLATFLLWTRRNLTHIFKTTEEPSSHGESIIFGQMVIVNQIWTKADSKLLSLIYTTTDIQHNRNRSYLQFMENPTIIQIHQ